MRRVELRLPLFDDDGTLLAPGAYVSLPPGGSPLKVEGREVGRVVEVLDVTPGRGFVDVVAEIDTEHEAFLGAVELGFFEGVSLR